MTTLEQLLPPYGQKLEGIVKRVPDVLPVMRSFEEQTVYGIILDLWMQFGEGLMINVQDITDPIVTAFGKYFHNRVDQVLRQIYEELPAGIPQSHQRHPYGRSGRHLLRNPKRAWKR